MQTDRTSSNRETAIGVFNVAHSYNVAAMSLGEADLDCTHKWFPATWLCYHSMELYLKSFLMEKGLSTSELARPPFGHNLKKLRECSKNRGLDIRDEYGEILDAVQNNNNVIDARYLTKGSKQKIKFCALSATCHHLHHRIVDTVYNDCSGVRRRPRLATFEASKLEALELPPVS